MAESFPPDGTVVRLNRETRVEGGGEVLVGGIPLRVARVKPAAARLIVDREVVVRDATSRALAAHLLRSGMGDVVAASLPAVDLALLTVVVPVYERATPLDRLLRSLPPGLGGVIVVDDASPRPAPIAAVTARRGAELVVLPENAGPAAARNAGLARVRTPFVAFVDSDVTVEPDAFDTMLRHLAGPTVALVAPRVEGMPEPHPTWITRYENTRSSLDLGRDRATVRPRSRVSWVSSTCLVGRVAALGDGFDERLRAAEDVDLVWRLVAAGHRVEYEPAAVVHHEHRARLGDWLRRKFFYGTGAHDLAERHGADVAPVVLAPWAVLLLVVLGMQRRWSLPVAGFVGGVVAARIASRIPDVPGRNLLGARLAANGALAALGQGSALLVRHWWPLAAVGALGSRRMRRALAVAALADAAVEYVRLRPTLDPVRFLVARRLDDLAYGAGVWWGAIRGRSAASLTPAIVAGSGDAVER